MKANPLVASAVKQLLVSRGTGGKPMTIREAEDRTGLSYTVVNRMVGGYVPGPDHVMRFAAAFDEDIVAWLEMCGYDQIASIIRAERGEKQSGQLDALIDEFPEAKRIAAKEAARKMIKTVLLPAMAE